MLVLPVAMTLTGRHVRRRSRFARQAGLTTLTVLAVATLALMMTKGGHGSGYILLGGVQVLGACALGVVVLGRPKARRCFRPPIPGWYADPTTPFQWRAWDGTAWTQCTSAMPQTRTEQPASQRVLPEAPGGTAALVFGILGVALVPLIPSPVAIVLGRRAEQKARLSPDLYRNSHARTGQILGWVGLAMFGPFLILFLSAGVGAQ